MSKKRKAMLALAVALGAITQKESDRIASRRKRKKAAKKTRLALAAMPLTPEQEKANSLFIELLSVGNATITPTNFDHYERGLATPNPLVPFTYTANTPSVAD